MYIYIYMYIYVFIYGLRDCVVDLKPIVCLLGFFISSYMFSIFFFCHQTFCFKIFTVFFNCFTSECALSVVLAYECSLPTTFATFNGKGSQDFSGKTYTLFTGSFLVLWKGKLLELNCHTICTQPFLV